MNARTIGAFLAVALLGGILPLWLALGAVPELDVHARPFRAHTGRLTQRFPVGQRFECGADGLERIEVALLELREAAQGSLRLTLFEEGLAAPLRAVDVTPGALALGGELVPFAFEPVPDSGGKQLHFVLEPIGEIKPANYSVAFRPRGGFGHDGAWGWVEQRGPSIEGRLRLVYARDQRDSIDPTGVEKPDLSPHANLRAVAFATRGVAPRIGPVRLELWEEGVEGAAVRTIELTPEDEVQNGWVVFGFEPIPESRWKSYRYVLTLHEGAILLGDELGPSMRTFHGLDGGDPRLLGMTLGEAERTDRDIVFRAWCEPDRGLLLARLRERAGGALWWGLLSWLAATALLALAINRAREVAPECPSV